MSNSQLIRKLKDSAELIGMPVLLEAATALDADDDAYWEMTQRAEKAEEQRDDAKHLADNLIRLLGVALGDEDAAKAQLDVVRRAEALERVLRIAPTPDGGIYFSAATYPSGADNLLKNPRVQGLYIDDTLTGPLTVLAETEAFHA